MTDWFGAVSAFAQTVSVTQDGEVRQGRAFVQPVSPISPDVPVTPTPAGVRDDRRYLIIAWPGAFVPGGRRALVGCGDKKFEVLRCELMGGGSHWEGIMRLISGDDNAA